MRTLPRCSSLARLVIGALYGPLEMTNSASQCLFRDDLIIAFSSLMNLIMVPERAFLVWLARYLLSSLISGYLFRRLTGFLVGCGVLLLCVHGILIFSFCGASCLLGVDYAPWLLLLMLRVGQLPFLDSYLSPLGFMAAQVVCLIFVELVSRNSKCRQACQFLLVFSILK